MQVQYAHLCRLDGAVVVLHVAQLGCDVNSFLELMGSFPPLLLLCSEWNSPNPRPDQVPTWASINTWRNIVQNKKDVLYCTKFFAFIDNRENCILQFTRHGMLAKDPHRSNAMLQQPAWWRAETSPAELQQVPGSASAS